MVAVITAPTNTLFRALRYLALGDSYTIGESVDPVQRWPEQWARLANAQGARIEQPVTVIAQTGWTTDELLQGIEASDPAGPWDLVSLLIGVNNQYRGRSLENFGREYAQLAETAIHLARGEAGRVQALSIPDWGQTPFGAGCGRDITQISLEIDAFNGCAEAVCESRGIAFLDITSLTRLHSADPHMHAEDGLHPSAQMYQLWAKALLFTGKFGRLSLRARETHHYHE
jgi:lysophospholipase L1-like esterase